MPRNLSKLEDQAYKALLRKEKQYELAVQRSLANALKDMRGEMAKLYDKYAVEGRLTLAEMTKYNRYATMEKQMMSILDPALLDNKNVLKKVPPNMYNEAFFREAWAIDNATGLRTAWGIVNTKTVMENLANPFSKISMATYGPEARNAVRRALNKGLPQGKSYDDMSKDLKQALNTTNYRALRIIRTEGQAAMNAGQNDAYLRAKKEGIQGDTIWDATLDGRTRPTHQAMDGQKKQPDGLYNGPGRERAPYPAYWGLSAEERIHCRCRERFQIEGYSPQLRRSREDGIIPYQKYDDWKKGRNTLRPKAKVKTPAEIMAEFGNGLTKLHSLGGSTGAYMAEDATGKRFVVKQYLNAAEPHNMIANEYIASQIYRQLGMDVPFSRLATINGKPAFVTEMIAGGKELGTQEAKAYLQKKVRKGFVADSYLANWDAIGLDADNILMVGIGNNAHVYRIDLGGSLLYRAQGAPKGGMFGKTVGELETLLTKNPQGKKWYGDVSKKEIVDQINELQNKIDLTEIKAIIDATQLDNELKVQLYSTLVERYVYLEEVRIKLINEIKLEQKAARAAKKSAQAQSAIGQAGDYYPPAPGISVFNDINYASDMSIHADDIARHMEKMNMDEKKVLSRFTGNTTECGRINENAINGNPDSNMINAIQKLPRTNANLMRVMNTATDDFDKWAYGNWDTVRWDAFQSCSFGDINWHGNTTFYIVNNTGRNLDAGLIGYKSEIHREKEVIVNRGSKFRVLGVAEEGNKRAVIMEPMNPYLPEGYQPAPIRYTLNDAKEIFERKRKLGNSSLVSETGKFVTMADVEEVPFNQAKKWVVKGNSTWQVLATSDGNYGVFNSNFEMAAKYSSKKEAIEHMVINVNGM